MDLPPVLENLLDHLLKTHGTIMSWNIYQGDNGFVNVNMRFPAVNGSNVDGHVESVSYRRVSGRQLSRNKARAETHRAKQNINNANVHTQTEHNNTKDTKKRKIDISSPEIVRNDHNDSFIAHNHDIDTPIKLQDFKVEYQVLEHDVSFSSCTSEVNNAQDSESARPQVLDLITHHGPQPEYTTDEFNENIHEIPALITFPVNTTVVESKELPTCFPSAMPEIHTCDNHIDSNETQTKFDTCVEITSPSKPKPILCPCCENIMTPSHICENEPSSDPNNIDEPKTPPPPVSYPPELINPPNTAEGFNDILNDPAFGECKAYLESESCKTQ